MIDREVLSAQQDFQEFAGQSTALLSPRMAIFLILLLCITGWMGITGLAFLIFG